MKEKSLNMYAIVFGIVVIIIIIAALSTFLFNQAPQVSANATVSLQNYGPAPNFQGIAAWINSQSLNITQLRGKVVLVDFWTYSCINCIRTIPFLEALKNEYGNDGLVIVGVSTPEFQFEHNLSNVELAVKRFNITYPVALDNNYSTWDAYNNHYWPADYLVDKNGNVRYISFGEAPSDFNQTQAAIRELLKAANYALPTNTINVKDALNFSQEMSPEMYFGYSELATGHTDYFAQGSTPTPNQNTTYMAQNVTLNDTIYLSGTWYSAPDGLIAVNNSKLFLIYRASKVNVVASSSNSVSPITIMLNGSALQTADYGGDDMDVNGAATVDVGTSKLYNVVAEPTYGWHTLGISASPGFKIYTFTFG